MKAKDLKSYKDSIANKPPMICPVCKEVYPCTRLTCQKCKTRLVEYHEEPANVPRCPVCQSASVRKISGAKRAAYGATFGLFSSTARSQFECLNCSYKF